MDDSETCGHVQDALLYDLGAVTDSTGSALSSEALVGTWLGVGDFSDRRLIMNASGGYKIQERAGNQWFRIQAGHYWVEIVQNKGLLRSELNMALGDSVDAEVYGVMYRIEDNLLILEESSETMMVFERKN